MEVGQITHALDSLFNQEHVRIVFWNDPTAESSSNRYCLSNSMACVYSSSTRLERSR